MLYIYFKKLSKTFKGNFQKKLKLKKLLEIFNYFITKTVKIILKNSIIYIINFDIFL